MIDVHGAAEALFREESGRIVATLIRICGSFDVAEEALQAAFAAALAAWPKTGLPNNPAAWITTAAHRNLIDVARREKTRREKQGALLHETPATYFPSAAISDDGEMNFPDDRLRLIFTCCHPILNQEAQVALTLRLLGGLSTPEIAKAFLLPEPTLAQRIVRAKKKLQESGIPYEVPRQEGLRKRLPSVQAVIYLIFNEGYAASSGSDLLRSDLCVEAIRLGRLLWELLPNEAENAGLLALMLLHHSRQKARLRAGRMVTLEDQDRQLWNRAEIAEGLSLTEQAFRMGPVGTYQLQAAIVALHANASRAADTDWFQISKLYERLFELQPTPVVALNHAVAVAMSAGFEEGLKRIDALGESGELDGYYLFHAARADLLRRMERFDEAAKAYHKASALATNPVEREYLAMRAGEVEG
jgi:RNA polymerase sigma-70 factor (ECF subfamily)